MERSIQVKHLSAGYGTNQILNGLDLEFPVGEIIGIIGPNGCGKSTLLKAILGLIPDVKGEVMLFDQPLDTQRDKIAYVPQRESVDWDFPISVREVVEMGVFKPRKWWRRKTNAEADQVDEALKKVGMHHFAEKPIGDLSGGQQQRVFVARALVQEAEVLILDEPFAGIDMVSQDQIWKNLHELRSQGKTLLIVHHDLQTARKHFDKLLMIHQGMVGAFDKPEIVLSKELLQQIYSGFILLNEE